MIADMHADAQNIILVSRASPLLLKLKFELPTAVEKDLWYSIGRLVLMTVTQAKK